MQSPHLTPEQLSASLDGQLSETDRRAVQAHLAGCASCRRQLEELRQTVALLRAVPAAAPPRSFRLPQAPAQPRLVTLRPWAQPAWLRAMGGAAAALMVVVLVADAVLPAAPLAPTGVALPASESAAPAAQRSLRAEPALDRAGAPPPGAEGAGVRPAPPLATPPALGERVAAQARPRAEQAARAGETAPESFASDPQVSGPSQGQVPIRPGQAGALALGLLAALLLTASLLVPRLRSRE